jgi:hypothetical protein
MTCLGLIGSISSPQLLAAESPAETPAAAESTTTPAAPSAEQPGTTPKKVLKKKKKKAAAGTESADTGNSLGHGSQDSGQPYKANLDFSFSFASSSRNQKYTDKTSKNTSSSLQLDLAYLFVFGSMEAGPMFSFSSGSEKEGGDSVATKSSGLGLGGAFVFNLANIQQDKTVPFVGLKIERTSKTNDVTSKTSAVTSGKTTDIEMSLGLEGGVKYFLGSHLALKPFLSYQLTMSGEHKVESSGSGASVSSVTGSDLTIGVGLSTYL